MGMQMLDKNTGGDADAWDDGNDTDKLEKENLTLKEKLGATTRELDVVKAQAKGFEREHDRLLSQIQELEDRFDGNPVEQKKKSEQRGSRRVFFRKAATDGFWTEGFK